MPLEGLRWSRDSGSALYDTPQTAVLGRAGGGSLIPGFMANALKHGGLPANFLATSCGKPR